RKDDERNPRERRAEERRARKAALNETLKKAPPTNDPAGSTPEDMEDARRQFDAEHDTEKLLPTGPAPTTPEAAAAEREQINAVLDLPSLDALAAHTALADGDGLVDGKSYADFTYE